MSAVVESAPGRPARVTRRRAETRQRLLHAALTVFAEEGFGASSVERVCEAAGYTRGAFYSNFSSLDELFLEMWAQQSARMLADLKAVVDRPSTRAIARGSTAQAVAAVLSAVPVDEQWYRISAEFTAHALRNPALRDVMAAREKAIVETLMPIVTAALTATGRTVTDPDALGAALVAVHDGTAVQCAMSPDDPAVFARRTDLFVRVIESFLTDPTSEGQS